MWAKDGFSITYHPHARAARILHAYVTRQGSAHTACLRHTPGQRAYCMLTSHTRAARILHACVKRQGSTHTACLRHTPGQRAYCMLTSHARAARILHAYVTCQGSCVFYDGTTSCIVLRTFRFAPFTPRASLAGMTQAGSATAVSCMVP